MKAKITAIAAGMLIAAAGAANAAEVLNVSQMDTVTAGGGNYDSRYGHYWRGKSFHDKYGRKYWYGHWKWHGKYYDFKCKDERGNESYGNVVNVVKNNTANANVNAKEGAQVAVVQLVGNVINGNVTIKIDQSQITKNNFDIKNFYANIAKPSDFHKGK
jgi:hypothetical protein